MNYDFYLNNFFVSVLEIQANHGKSVPFFQDCGSSTTDFDGDFQYVQWEAVLSMNTKIQIITD